MMGVAKEVPAQAAQPVRLGPPPRGRVGELKAPTTPSTVIQGSSASPPSAGRASPPKTATPLPMMATSPRLEKGAGSKLLRLTAATARTSS